jgi:hypothetical protein
LFNGILIAIVLLLLISNLLFLLFTTKEAWQIAINPDKFDKLITSLRTAVDNDGTLDEEATSFNDIFDAFRLALKLYHFEDTSSEYA